LLFAFLGLAISATFLILSIILLVFAQSLTAFTKYISIFDAVLLSGASGISLAIRYHEKFH
jgi:hypothetical protein